MTTQRTTAETAGVPLPLRTLGTTDTQSPYSPSTPGLPVIPCPLYPLRVFLKTQLQGLEAMEHGQERRIGVMRYTFGPCPWSRRSGALRQLFPYRWEMSEPEDRRDLGFEHKATSLGCPLAQTVCCRWMSLL